MLALHKCSFAAVRAGNQPKTSKSVEDRLYVIRAAGGRLRLIGAVISGYGYEISLRTGESRGGFRSAAETDGQAGGVTCGAGRMRIREWRAGTPRRGVPATHLARDLRMCPLRIHLLSFAQFWLALAGS